MNNKQITLNKLPNFLNNLIKTGSVITRVVRNGVINNDQLVFVEYITLKK